MRLVLEAVWCNNGSLRERDTLLVRIDYIANPLMWLVVSYVECFLTDYKRVPCHWKAAIVVHCGFVTATDLNSNSSSFFIDNTNSRQKHSIVCGTAKFPSSTKFDYFCYNRAASLLAKTTGHAERVIESWWGRGREIVNSSLGVEPMAFWWKVIRKMLEPLCHGRGKWRLVCLVPYRVDKPWVQGAQTLSGDIVIYEF